MVATTQMTIVIDLEDEFLIDAAQGCGWTATIDDPDDVVAEGDVHSGKQVTNPVTEIPFMVGMMGMGVKKIMRGIVEANELKAAKAIRDAHNALMATKQITIDASVSTSYVSTP